MARQQSGSFRAQYGLAEAHRHHPDGLSQLHFFGREIAFGTDEQVDRSAGLDALGQELLLFLHVSDKGWPF